MIADIRNLLDEYVAWLKDRTLLRRIDETWVEITAPYLDRHNDYLQIYAKRTDGGFLLSDDGFTIDDLEASGCKLASIKRKKLLEQTLNGFGVQLNHGRVLEVNASAESFSVRKHSLVQAMLAVNDLFYLAEPMVASLFQEDVAAWLDLCEIRYTPKVKFTGKSGYDHLFDFVIPKSRTRPERIVRAVNRPTNDAAKSIAFSWLDTREVRTPDSRAYALLNDFDHPIPSGVLDALRSYDVDPVAWSKRDDIRQELAA